MHNTTLYTSSNNYCGQLQFPKIRVYPRRVSLPCGPGTQNRNTLIKRYASQGKKILEDSLLELEDVSSIFIYFYFGYGTGMFNIKVNNGEGFIFTS